MPQMAPLMWLMLFFIFILTFLMFNILNYYNFFKSNKTYFKKKLTLNNYSLDWKW